MIASLPMYDRAETREAHDRLYAAFRDHLGYGPNALNREIAYDASWNRRDLLLGQICNLPYRVQFRSRLTPIACGDHQLPDTPAGFYYSVFIVREEDADRGLAPAALGRFAYSDAMSHSGWGAPFARLAEQGLQFRDTLRTGSHEASVRAVASGRADLAAIDAVTWRMMCQWDPDVAALRVIGRTGLSPAMTFVTTAAHDPDVLRPALEAAISDLSDAEKDLLRLYGLRVVPAKAYDIPLPPAPKNDSNPAAKNS